MRLVPKVKVQKTDAEKEKDRAERDRKIAENKRQEAERKEKAEAKAKDDAFWAETPEVIQAEITEAEGDYNDALWNGQGGEIIEDLKQKLKDLKQKLADKKAWLKDYNEKLMQPLPATLEELQVQISKLREREQAEPNNEAVKRALGEKQWRSRDLKQRQDDDKKEAKRLGKRAETAARFKQAIETNDPSKLNGGEKAKWWEEEGKRQAEKWRIKKCRAEIENTRMNQDAPAEPAEGEQVSLPSSSLSPKEWEKELNERLKALNAREVAEAVKRHKADREEFGDCYR